MSPTLNLLSILNLLGAVQGLFLVFTFLALRKGNRLAHILLGLMLLFTALTVFDVLLCYSNYIIYVPFLVNSTESLIFLHGPLSLFYALALTQPNFTINRHYFPHFLPFIAHFIYRLPFHFQSNAHKLDDVFTSFQRPYLTNAPAKQVLWYPNHQFIDGTTLDWLITINLAVYAFLTFRVIVQYARQQNTSWWRTTNLSLNWLGRVWIFFLGILLIFAFCSVYFERDLGDIYIITAISVVFYALCFYVISHSSLLDTDKENKEKKKYEKSVLGTETSSEALKKLMTCMINEKPYLDSNLTLPELAKKVSLSTHHLSQLINEHLHQNFFDFVNSYRIEEIKNKLHNPSMLHIKIEEIALETGFNSKSAFHTAFKKFTQTTPAQFRKTTALAVNPLKI